VKNLPTEDDENGTLDGFCTFNPIIDINIEIDYQLSQLGRGLKYNADPEIALKEPIEPHDGRGVNVVRSSSRKIEVSEKGDVKLLEMQGGGMKIQLEYIEKLRNFALETLRGSRKDPQRALSHAQSGKLAEMLEDDLVSLVSELRTSYTCGMLLPMTIKMVVAMKKHRMGGSEVKRITADDLLSLKYEWGPWFPPTSTDIYQVAEASDKLVKGLLVDIDTVRAMTYHTLGRVMPKNVDFEINLTAIAKAERAANLWQLENTALKAAATPDTSEMEGLGPEATPEAKQAAKERSQADAALKGMQILEDIREESEAEDNGESGPGEGITLEDVYDVHTPIN
jgi:hypothetical protein